MGQPANARYGVNAARDFYRSAADMIEELTQIESELIDRVRSVTGLMEEKQAALKTKVFAEYSLLHSRYTELVDDTNCGREALKRALFIQWSAVSEPACFSGICGVEKSAEEYVLKALDDLAQKRGFDEELRFMLYWYYEVTDWYFDRQDTPHLRVFLNANPHVPPHYRKSDFANRGQMGKYWQSLNIGIAEPSPPPYGSPAAGSPSGEA
jgi:hypothetical protein